MGFDLFTEALFWGLTLSFVGKVLLGVTVINVHAHIIKEHRIDMDVLKEMKRERKLGVVAVFLIMVGYLLEISHFGYLPF